MLWSIWCNVSLVPIKSHNFSSYLQLVPGKMLEKLTSVVSSSRVVYERSSHLYRDVRKRNEAQNDVAEISGEHTWLVQLAKNEATTKPSVSEITQQHLHTD